MCCTKSVPRGGAKSVPRAVQKVYLGAVQKMYLLEVRKIAPGPPEHSLGGLRKVRRSPPEHFQGGFGTSALVPKLIPIGPEPCSKNVLKSDKKVARSASVSQRHFVFL